MNHEQTPVIQQKQQELETLPRNLLTYPAETFRAMALVEGPAWAERQAGILKDEVSDGEWEGSLPYAVAQAKSGKSTKVEGQGNVSRWKVAGDGSVTFYCSIHSDASHRAESARKLGFEVKNLD